MSRVCASLVISYTILVNIPGSRLKQFSIMSRIRASLVASYEILIKIPGLRLLVHDFFTYVLVFDEL